MSIKAIQEITEAEALTQEKKSLAQAEAKRIVADAERAGKALLAQTRKEAEAENRDLLAKAEENAGVRAKQVAADTQLACQALCQDAGAKLDAAAELIVKRIVMSDGHS